MVYVSTVHSKRDAPRPWVVCVYCASGPTHPELLALAAELGEAIAERGWTLVWGGGNVSAMGALATAARARGAWTVGVIPKMLVRRDFPGGALAADVGLDAILPVVVNDLLARWRKPDGSFRARELLLGWDNVPMHRWAQAQLFRSFCFLIDQQGRR